MKKKNKFNIIDFFICFVIFTVLVLSAVWLSEGYKDSFFTGFGKTPVEITVTSVPISKEYLDKISVGQTVVNFETGDDLGRISNIQFFDCESEDEKLSFYAIIDIDSKAKPRDNHYIINGEKLLVNKITKFSVPELYFEGRISSVASPGYNK